MNELELLIMFGFAFIGSLALVLLAMIVADIIEMRREE